MVIFINQSKFATLMSPKTDRMILTLPGFFPLVYNEVYAKRATYPEFQEVITLEVNSPPTEDDVAEYLQIKAAEILEHRKFSGKPLIRGERARHNLEQLMCMTPNDKLLALVLGRDEVINLVKASTPAPHPSDYFSGREYLTVSYGYLPHKLVQKQLGLIQKLKGDKLRSTYEEALADPELDQRGLGERFNFRILIEKGRTFPNKETMISLISEGVHGSPIFDVGHFLYNRQVVESIVHSLYDALSEPRRFERLRDTTEVSLVKYSLNSASVLNDYDPSVYRSTTSGLFGRDPAPHPDVLKERMLDNKLN